MSGAVFTSDICWSEQQTFESFKPLKIQNNKAEGEWSEQCLGDCSKVQPPSYLPQVSGVPDGSRLQFVQQQGDSLERADPGPLRDPLSCTDPITQSRDRTGAQTHLKHMKI